MASSNFIVAIFWSFAVFLSAATDAQLSAIGPRDVAGCTEVWDVECLDILEGIIQLPKRPIQAVKAVGGALGIDHIQARRPQRLPDPDLTRSTARPPTTTIKPTVINDPPEAFGYTSSTSSKKTSTTSSTSSSSSPKPPSSTSIPPSTSAPPPPPPPAEPTTFVVTSIIAITQADSSTYIVTEVSVITEAGPIQTSIINTDVTVTAAQEPQASAQSTSSSTTSSTSSSSSTPSPSLDPQLSSQTPSPALTPTTKLALGLSIGLGAPLILAISAFAFILLRKRRKQNKTTVEEDSVEDEITSPAPVRTPSFFSRARWKAQPRAELQGDDRFPVPELHGKWAPAPVRELEGGRKGSKESL